MSLIIITTSHGNVEGGFFSVYTGGFRFGQYAFPTQNMHNMLRVFAEKPSCYAINLTSFGEETFWDSANAYFFEIANQLVEMGDSLLPELAKAEFDRRLAAEQGHFEKDKIPQLDLEYIPVRIPEDESEVSFGEYRIDRENFRGLSAYVLNGGWMGWEGQYPEAASKAIDAIRRSQRPLFEGLEL